MKRLWLHSVLILLVKSHGSRYQTLFVNQGRHHTWRDLCHRHFVFVQLFLLKHDSLNDYFWIQIDNYKKHCFVRETYRAYRWPFFQWKNLTNSTTEQTEQTRQTDSMIDFGEFPSLSLESPSVVTSIQYVCYLYDDNKSGSSVTELRCWMLTKDNSSRNGLLPTLDALVLDLRRALIFFINICLIFFQNSFSSFIKNIKYNIEKGFFLFKVPFYIKQFFPYRNDSPKIFLKHIFFFDSGYLKTYIFFSCKEKGGRTWKQAFQLRRKFLVAKETKHVYNVTCDMSFQNKSKLKQIFLNKSEIESTSKRSLNVL